MELDEVRREIGRLDDEIRSLAERRMRLWDSIADIQREKRHNRLSPLAEEIRTAAAACERQFSQNAFVACCGAEGSYAQQAASQLVKSPTIVYFSGFEKVFEAVEKGLCPYGVLPVENSAAGSVAAVYDLMQKHSFHIARSLRLKVDHVLLAPSGVAVEDVREIVSHPHALAQCSAFLKRHPNVKATPAVNTAVSARDAASSGRSMSFSLTPGAYHTCARRRSIITPTE